MTAVEKPLPKASEPAPAPFLAPWLAFLAAGFCFIAGGFRLTANELRFYEFMNVELPWILEVQVDLGAKLGVAFVAVGLALLLLTQWQPRRGALVKLASALTHLAGVGAVLASVLILYSGDLIFLKLQIAYQQ
jgi:hypothetical protein